MWDGGWTKIPLLFGSQEAISKERLRILLRVNQMRSHLSDSMLDSIWSFPLPLFLCLLSSSLWDQDSDQISTPQSWRQNVLTAMGWRGSSSADMLTDVLISHLHNGTQKDNNYRIARL